MNQTLIDVFECLFLFVFVLLFWFFVVQARKRINFYSMWSTILMCVGLFFRIVFVAVDLVIKIAGGNSVSDYCGNWGFCKYVFVYSADCCFYFSFFAIGCDWTELCVAFKMLLKASSPEAFEAMRLTIKKVFVGFLAVFVVLIVFFLIANCFPVSDTFWTVAIYSLILYQLVLIILYLVLYASVLYVTVQIRKSQQHPQSAA